MLIGERLKFPPETRQPFLELYEGRPLFLQGLEVGEGCVSQRDQLLDCGAMLLDLCFAGQRLLNALLQDTDP